MKEIYDIITRKNIIFEENKIQIKCEEMGLDRTSVYRVLHGVRLHVGGRFILPKNKNKIFTLIEKDTEIERDCIVNKSIFLYFNLLPTENEIKYVYELKNGRQKFANICDRIFYLKTENGIPIIKKQINSHKHKREILNKDFLQNEHVIKNKSVHLISKELNISMITIKYYLNKYGIKINNCYDVKSGKENARWSGFGDISGSYWSSLLHGANRRGINFNITKEYAWEIFLKQDRKCSMCGDVLFFEIENMNGQTASLDRIDSSKGYIAGNVQWIHKDINKMKWDMKIDNFIDLCKKISNNYK